MNNGQPLLYAADDGKNRRVDVFDSNFQPVDLGPGAFVDPKIPPKYAPYGIQAITAADGTQTIWVTYTALDKAQNGFVAAFPTAGVLKSDISVNGPLHSPWGVAFAPDNFGPMSNALLISNNIPRAHIDAFDPNSGAFLGSLRDTTGKVIEIDDIWAIQFGQGGMAGANGNPTQALSPRSGSAARDTRALSRGDRATAYNIISAADKRAAWSTRWLEFTRADSNRKRTAHREPGPPR